jgi:hypothetical protein
LMQFNHYYTKIILVNINYYETIYKEDE